MRISTKKNVKSTAWTPVNNKLCNPKILDRWKTETESSFGESVAPPSNNKQKGLEQATARQKKN
jgi:hypothetical protein